MDEMIPFLRTIAEHPDEDTPRLVFADWLEEHEHPDRAKFIRLQIELARMDPSDDGYPEKTAAMRRCGMFTTEGEFPFFDHLPTDECKFVFQRGFIESIDTNHAEELDTSGFDLIPILALRTGSKHIDKFKGFTKLKWFEYFNGHGSTSSPAPAKLLEILGPKGWFKNLEELSLPYLDAACLEAGVIPQFDLPRLRNFYIYTDDFSNLGAPVAGGSEEDDDDYGQGRPWSGLADYLPKNALPNRRVPLERFIWHCDDDSDSYGDDGWEWRGPTMESLLAHLKGRNLKQIEVAVDYDDHENGSEGARTAGYEHNPLKVCPTLERVTLSGGNLQLLEGSTQKLKALRVYADSDLDDYLFTLLNEPVCSDLESLHVEVRGWWNSEPRDGPNINFPKLKSLSSPLLGQLSNCQFPSLISLQGFHDLKLILQRKWPRLQCLGITVSSEHLSDLERFAQSDCCPNLTTLTISGYFYQSQPDFSILANCPHMPFLSLIRISGHPQNQSWIVDDGELVPIRSDVMLDPQTPTTPYRISSAFESTVNER